MRDILLEELMKQERWEDAVQHGVDKDMSKAMLIKLCKPETRIEFYRRIKNNGYAIAPPRIGLIPKDEPGEYREVMICQPFDRVFLSIANNVFFDMFPDFVSKNVYSYKKGMSCGAVVKDVNKCINRIESNNIGKKYDMRKFFDSVEIGLINDLFDRMESVHGKSVVIDVVREFYNSNILFDEKGNLVEVYKSIKQGTATSAFLADAMLKDIDEYIPTLPNIRYWRYSDDILVIGSGYERADVELKQMLAEKHLAINPKKEELLTKDRWFKFLGFTLKGDMISLSKSRIKTFQKEIESRTKGVSFESALHKVNAYLYKGDYPWSSAVLSTINCEQDIQRLNSFIMDSLRGSYTRKQRMYGLGFNPDGKDGVIPFAKGKNVRMNRQKLPYIDGYISLMAYKKAPHDVKNAMVLQL